VKPRVQVLCGVGTACWGAEEQAKNQGPRSLLRHWFLWDKRQPRLIEKKCEELDRPEKLELEDKGLENFMRGWKREAEKAERLRLTGREGRNWEWTIFVGSETAPYILYSKIPIWLMLDQCPLLFW
jgi:hypothetical protein